MRKDRFKELATELEIILLQCTSNEERINAIQHALEVAHQEGPAGTMFKPKMN